jgi:hypothetical protein
MDEDRKAILTRRARFLAAAVAGAGLSAAAQSCASDQKPRVCLEPPYSEIIVPEADAGPEEPTDAGLPPRTASPEAAPPPREPYPRICLSEY